MQKSYRIESYRIVQKDNIRESHYSGASYRKMISAKATIVVRRTER